MDIGQRIKELLIEKNRKQIELADFLGVRQNTISDWINQGKSPSCNHVYRICDFFNVSFNYLFTGRSEKSPPPDLAESELEILKVIHPLSDKDRIKIIGIIENYLATRTSSGSTIQPIYLKEEQIEQVFKSSTKKPL